MEKKKLIAQKFIKNVCTLNKRSIVLIIYDNESKKVSKHFYNALKNQNFRVKFIKIASQKNHGFEPPKIIFQEMIKSTHVLCITKFSMAHSLARKKFSRIGGRFLSMPSFSEKILLTKAVTENFVQQEKLVDKISKILSKGKKCRIESPDGSFLISDISGRKGNSCPGHVKGNKFLGSPPDIESNISPKEKKSNGTLVINGSVADQSIGLIKDPIKLEIKNGKIIKINSASKKNLFLLKNIFKRYNSKAKILAEIGIGMNKKSELTGNMLTDEGAYGCIHFGFGSNFSVGGKNKVGFHLDFISKNHSLYIDEKKIIENGKIL